MTPDEELELLRLRKRRAAAASRTAETGPSQDPNAYGPAETANAKAAEAIPLGVPIANVLSAALMQQARRLGGAGQPRARLGKAAEAQMRRLGASANDPNVVGPIEVREAPEMPGPIEEYRNIRDERATRTARGQAENPNAANVGTGVGLGLSILAPLPKVSLGAKSAVAGGKAVTGTQRVLSNALTAAGYGGVMAAEKSKGDLTKGEFGTVLGDAALGTGLGLGLGGILGLGMEGLNRSGATEKVAQWLKDRGIDQGRKVLTNGADQLSRRKELPAPVVEEAIRSDAIKALGTHEGAASRLKQLTGEVGDEYGQIISALEARGVKGPDAKQIADELVSEANRLRPETMTEALPNAYERAADQIRGKVVDPQSGRLGLRQAERLKRSLQDEAMYGKVEETPLNMIKRDIASRMRGANEKAIEEAAISDPSLAPIADRFVPVKQRLGRLLEAESAAARGTARGAQRGANSDFGFKSAAAAVAAGQPALIGAGMASNVMKARLPSTIAERGLHLSDLLRNQSGGEVGRAEEIIRQAFKSGDDEKLKALIKALGDSQ